MPLRIAMLIMFLVCGHVGPAAAKAVVGFVTGTPGLGDAAFNDMAHAGALKAQREYGFDLVILEPGPGDRADVNAVRRLVGTSDLVVLLGEEYLDVARSEALAHPDKTFVLVDAQVEGAPNLSSVVFDQHEGAFLAGALAAGVSATGTIGFVGGSAIGPVRAFERGYREGAAFMNPGVTVISEYASPAGDFTGFSDPEKGYRMAMGQFQRGADIVFAAAGRTGAGVIDAARESGKLAIGVDSDQDALAQGVVLTSVIKRLDTATYGEIKKVMDGAFRPGPIRYGLKDGGVRLSEMVYTRDRVPAAVLAKLAGIKDGIIQGTIPVTDVLAGN